MPSSTEGQPAIARLAYSKSEAAEVLGVGVDFFDDHIAHELRCVRRGRRYLYARAELERWLEREAEAPCAPRGGRVRVGG
jgi:excisionase family DNA binding protein